MDKLHVSRRTITIESLSVTRVRIQDGSDPKFICRSCGEAIRVEDPVATGAIEREMEATERKNIDYLGG